MCLGANADILGILQLMQKLEQLQISCVNHDFISNVPALSHLRRLKRLHIQVVSIIDGGGQPPSIDNDARTFREMASTGMAIVRYWL